jgi:hypothetical protein
VSGCPRTHAGVAILIAQLALAAPALASDTETIEAASRMFEQGTAEQRRGDYRSAAQSYARADELVPDPAALEAALKASLLADDPVLGMTLVERSRRGPMPTQLARTVEAVRAKFSQRAGRIAVRCAGCRVIVDGQPIEVDAPRWFLPGEHEVVIEAAGHADRRMLQVDAGSITDVVPLMGTLPIYPPPGATPSERTVTSGLSPAWFWVALGTTAAAAGATIASGLDTAAKHDAFSKVRSRDGADEGQSAETRTNVLAGVTAVLGLATAGIGLFAVRWSATEPPATATLDLAPERALARIQGRF